MRPLFPEVIRLPLLFRQACSPSRSCSSHPMLSDPIYRPFRCSCVANVCIYMFGNCDPIYLSFCCSCIANALLPATSRSIVTVLRMHHSPLPLVLLSLYRKYIYNCHLQQRRSPHPRGCLGQLYVGGQDEAGRGHLRSRRQPHVGVKPIWFCRVQAGDST